MSVVRIRLERGPALRAMTHGDYLRVLRKAALGVPGGRDSKSLVATGPQLPLGYTSRCEYADLDLGAPLPAGCVRASLPGGLPEGIVLRWARRVPRFAPPLRACVTGYWYTLMCSVQAEKAEPFRHAATWPYERVRGSGKRQTLDLKTTVERLAIEPGKVRMRIAIREGGVPKPEEVLRSVFGIADAGPDTVPIERTEARMAPLELRRAGRME
jgi:hypothetical protein